MEPKKNPRYDVHRYRSVLFGVSLSISLLLVIIAFEWSQSVNTDIDQASLADPFEGDTLYYVAPFREIMDESPIKPLKKKKSTVPNYVAVKDELPETTDGEELPAEPPVEEGKFSISAIEMPVPENVDTIFTVVEHMPEPVGGWSALAKTLKKNLKYPSYARRVGVAGKVFIEFTIAENGSMTALKVVRGIGYGCDEEALRVIALTKWKAGRQRGRPVKVKLVQPIYFSLE
jgi:protein TonB